MTRPAMHGRQRDLMMFRNPNLWQCWPFLPVLRPSPDGTGQQLGVLCDALGKFGRYGYSATVFLTNLFMLPGTEEKLFELPMFMYDTADELAADGWNVD